MQAQGRTETLRLAARVMAIGSGTQAPSAPPGSTLELMALAAVRTAAAMENAHGARLFVATILPDGRGRVHDLGTIGDPFSVREVQDGSFPLGGPVPGGRILLVTLEMDRDDRLVRIEAFEDGRRQGFRAESAAVVEGRPDGAAGAYFHRGVDVTDLVVAPPHRIGDIASVAGALSAFAIDPGHVDARAVLELAEDMGEVVVLSHAELPKLLLVRGPGEDSYALVPEAELAARRAEWSVKDFAVLSVRGATTKAGSRWSGVRTVGGRVDGKEPSAPGAWLSLLDETGGAASIDRRYCSRGRTLAGDECSAAFMRAGPC